MQLENLQADPSASARFSTLEGQLELTFSGNARGTIGVTGQAIDNIGEGNRLSFGISIDQSFLPDLIAELRALEARFPAGSLR